MSERDKFIRELHSKEKFEKLKNPNHYISDSSITLISIISIF